MARETRRQRRAARAAAAEAQTARRSRQAQVRPAQQPVKQQTGRKVEQPRRGQFLRESAAELRKVDWPSRRQTFQGVVVVIIACAIVGAYLWGIDQILRPLVNRVFL
ncbi:MAG: preprotein translocase subunit SecE [Thermoleophilia bacterium]|nr:preprotein translocase subunit SecE [Gaiellaceae bacterium]MDW8338364.1 preprotein translocase subunit SecE [Thermoleophilia bacterium]